MDLPSPYQILGLPEKTDNQQEIKQAYRAMALKFHPDKNPNAGDKFQEINKAYQILSNEDSKLFYDSFGYEGLILNEKLNSRGDNNLMEWAISLSFCSISMVLDYFFGIYTEWIFASIFTLYFIYLTKKSPDLSFCLFILISNLILYFILPTKILPTITNIVIYGIVLLWPNITKKNSTLTVTIWISIIIIDIWRGIKFEHWIWRFLSLNIIIFGSIILMLMGIYVIKKPETGPAFYYHFFTLLYKILKNLDVMTLVFIMFWCPVWLLDYLTGRRIEWLIPPAIFLIKLFVFDGKIKIFLPLIASGAFVYYLVPMWIYHFASNYIIHLLSHLLVFKLKAALVEKFDQEPDPQIDEREKQLLQKPMVQIKIGILFFILQYFFDFSTDKWYFLGATSLGYSFVLLVELYFFSFSIKNTDEEDQQQEQQEQQQQQQQQQLEEKREQRERLKKEKQSLSKKQSSRKPKPTTSQSLSSQPPAQDPSSDSIELQETNSDTKQTNESLQNYSTISFSVQNDSIDSDSANSGESAINSSPNTKKLQQLSSAMDKRCQTCFKSTSLKKCGRCQQVYYCSKECQIKNWNFHKSICSGFS